MLWSSFNPRHSEAVGTIDGGGELPGIFFQGFLTNTLNPKVAHFFAGRRVLGSGHPTTATIP
jgi:threonine/homoserine/homoserine lactone efflux protein